MKNLLYLALLLTGWVLGSCSTTFSPGTRTLSPDRELANPSPPDSVVVDTVTQPK